MKKTVMIIGGGLLQLPLIKTAKNMGLQVIVTDYNPEVIGLKLADIPIIMSTRDIEGSVRIARKQSESTPIHGVLTCGTDASMTVAAVANALGLPGIKFEDAEAATNKIKMRTRFKEHGVPSPKFCSVWTLTEAKKACNEIGLPLVIKPCDNMGARGVRMISDKNEISEAFHQAKSASPSGELIIEEFMDGHELSVDAVIFNGEITFTGIADRIIEDLPYFIEKGHTMPSQMSIELLEETKQVMTLGIKALGLEHGFAKGDIKLTADGVKIGELAARLSGGFMSTHTFPYSSGVNLMKAAIEIALGEEPGNLEPVKELVSIERAIITRPGLVKSISGLEEAKALAHINDIYMSVKPGDTVVKPTSNVEKAGHIIATANTLEEAEEAVKKAKELIVIEIAETSEITIDLIRARAREKFNKTCLVCRNCNGENCVTGVPGMGSLGEGLSFKRNIDSLAEYKIVTKVLHGIDKVDTSVELFGKRYAAPIVAAPITGAITNMNGAIEESTYAESIAVGSYNAGIVAMVGDGASPEKYMKGLAAIEKSGAGIPIFKPRENEQIIVRIKEAEKAGATAVGIDVDAVAFTTMKLKKQSTFPKSFEDLEYIIQSTSLPVIVKGIMSAYDAHIAIEAGASAIVVSNHGGRVLDGMPGAMDVLEDIVTAVDGRISVIADGGFRSGDDILKALALGASAVSIGRPFCVAAVGMYDKGVEFYAKQLIAELERVMLLTGCASIDEVTKECVLKIK